MQCFHVCPSCHQDFVHKVPSDSPLDNFRLYCSECGLKEAQINPNGMFTDTLRGRKIRRAEDVATISEDTSGDTVPERWPSVRFQLAGISEVARGALRACEISQDQIFEDLPEVY